MGSYKNLTTFDFLKTFAVIMMIIDHVGFYFLTPPLGADIGDPALWLRVFGRFCVPIWFFLIGYARTQTIPLTWVAGAVILIAVNVMTGMFIFPLNTLVSMMIIRLVIPVLVPRLFATRESMMGGIVILFLGFSLTNEIFEYGTMGVLIGLMGYAIRGHRDGKNVGVLNDRLTLGLFLSLGVAAVLASQYMSFRFDLVQTGTTMAGMMLAFVALFFIRPREYPILNKVLPHFFRSGIQVCGRRTLEIYVIHLILFKIAALVFGLGFPIYGWFDWDWTIYGAFQNVK